MSAGEIEVRQEEMGILQQESVICDPQASLAQQFLDFVEEVASFKSSILHR